MKDTSLLKSGERLSELLNQGMTWTPGQAFALIEPVAEQAALAHEQGKQAGLTGPEDIFITERLWFCFFTAGQTEKKLAGQAGKFWIRSLLCLPRNGTFPPIATKRSGPGESRKGTDTIFISAPRAA